MLLRVPCLERNTTCVLQSPVACLGNGCFPNLYFDKCGSFPGGPDHRDCADTPHFVLSVIQRGWWRKWHA